MKVARIAQSRPTLLFEISELAQITEGNLRDNRAHKLRRMNKAIKYAIDNRLRLKIPKLYLDSL